MRWNCEAQKKIGVMAILCLMNGMGAELPSTPMPPDLVRQPGIVKQEFIFLDAPFRSCHASTIAEGIHGLVAAWFGGKQEGDRSVGIWVSRYEQGRWTPPERVAVGWGPSGQRLPCWNPVLFQVPNGPLLLFYKVGPHPSSWWGMVKRSWDGGRTWSRARPLPKGILGPIKDKPILLSDGRLLCGSSTEDQGWRIHFEWTSDWGRVWVRTQPLNNPYQIAAIQPTFLILDPKGHIRALGRTRQRHIFVMDSTDGGITWGKIRLSALPNPNSGIDAVTLADGRHLLVYNHTSHGRSPLNVAVSEDGEHWMAALTLENRPGEYSYPAVIQTADGLVHITYTWRRIRIAHVVLDPRRFHLRPIRNGRWPSASEAK